jgi:hypothetical protein
MSGVKKLDSIVTARSTDLLTLGIWLLFNSMLYHPKNQSDNMVQKALSMILIPYNTIPMYDYYF